jgi:hypothetical protein
VKDGVRHSMSVGHEVEARKVDWTFLYVGNAETRRLLGSPTNQIHASYAPTLS